MSYLIVLSDVCLLLVYAYTVLSMKSTNKVEYTINRTRPCSWARAGMSKTIRLEYAKVNKYDVLLCFVLKCERLRVGV